MRQKKLEHFTPFIIAFSSDLGIFVVWVGELIYPAVIIIIIGNYFSRDVYKWGHIYNPRDILFIYDPEPS